MVIDYTAHAINHKGNDAVVLTGSLGTIQEIRESQVTALSEEYQVIAPDTCGHSESPTPEGGWDMSYLATDLIEVPNEENTDRTHFVGLSLGGATAQTIALEYTDHVASLTLSSTTPRFSIPEVWQKRAELVHDKDTVALADTVVHNWFTDEYFDTTPELLAHLRDMTADCPDDGYVDTCGAFSRFDTRECLAEVTAPTLVIAGKQDASTSLDVVTPFHDGIEGSTMVVISSARHLLSQETPEHFSSALLVHIDGIVD